jgi:hypothetical protein
MPQVSTQEFERLPLRVHTFLAGVPLHDVWSVDLPRWRAGITLDEFLRTASNGKLDTCGCSKSSSLFTPSPLVRMLLDIRLFVGRFFGWEMAGNRTNSLAKSPVLLMRSSATRFMLLSISFSLSKDF